MEALQWNGVSVGPGVRAHLRLLLVCAPCETLLSLKMVAQYRFATPKPLKTCRALAFNPRFRLLNLLSNRPLEYGVFDLSRKSGTVQRELFGLPPKTTNPQERGKAHLYPPTEG